ncbi:hypothetical protein [Massilia aquatica]|uniref:Uncharacterized protein n=1 Tax=Massilia aquatica TaxID=2609000 RepID=A0ABX0MB30_9BURK|nr:hypothetical protein [Massilia aquatica]NHZ44414.1 hypothetical protein [Massilia aquatica]
MYLPVTLFGNCSSYISKIANEKDEQLNFFANALSKNLDKKTDIPFPVHRFHELHLPAILLADDQPLNIHTFKIGDDAITGSAFNPKTHMKVFFNIQQLLYTQGKYTSFKQHCFADPL